jgi:hypothetical protein
MIVGKEQMPVGEVDQKKIATGHFISLVVYQMISFPGIDIAYFQKLMGVNVSFGILEAVYGRDGLVVQRHLYRVLIR